MGLRRPTRRGTLLALATVSVAIVLGVSGYAVALSLTVTKGPTEHAIGNYVAGSNLGSWWTLQKLATGTVPGTATSPSNLSASPTTLPPSGNVSYSVNGRTGASALFWVFQVTTAAPSGQELELRLNYSLSGNTSRFVVYLSLPAGGLSGTLGVRVYFATAAPALTGGTIQSVTEFTAKCTSLGRCP